MKRLVTINALLLESSNPVASGCCFELQSSSKWKGPREGVYTFMAGSSSIISSLRLAGSLSIQRAFSSSTAGSAGVNYKSLLRPWKAMKLTQESLDEVRQQSLGTLSLVELVHQVMLIDTWPKAFPFPPECFDKLDGAPDADFYKVPKLDMHISEQIAECLEKRWYADLLPMACDAHLELGAGVRSYFPESYTPSTVIGYGMNMAEMERNDVLTERHVQDLNMNPHLPYQSNVVDCITLAFSIQYLTQPHLVLSEAHRLLRPGGILIVSYTDRCFETKVTDLWYRSSMLQRALLCRGYLQYSGAAGCWSELRAGGSYLDDDEPLIVMWARKS